MMPLHQERLDVKVFLKKMLLFHTHTGPRSNLIIFSVLVRSLPSTT